MKLEALVELSRKAEGMNSNACFGVHTRDFSLLGAMEQFIRRRDNPVGGETEFFKKYRCRSAGAECFHADYFSRKAYVMLPAQFDSRFHGNPGSERGRQNTVTIILGLAIENFPAGKRDNSYRRTVFRKLAGGGKC